MLALLTALVFVGGVIASAFSAASASSPTPQTEAVVIDPVLGALTLCTSPDHQQLPAEGGSEPGSQSGHCVLCTLAAAVSSTVNLTVTPVAFCESLIGVAPPVADVRSLAEHLRLGGIHSRAPPHRA